MRRSYHTPSPETKKFVPRRIPTAGMRPHMAELVFELILEDASDGAASERIADCAEDDAEAAVAFAKFRANVNKLVRGVTL